MYCIFIVLQKACSTDVHNSICITKPPLIFNKVIRRFSFIFVLHSSTGSYLPLWYSAKVMHIVHKLCENTIQLGTNYKMYQAQYTVLFGRVGTGTCIILLLNIPVKIQQKLAILSDLYYSHYLNFYL